MPHAYTEDQLVEHSAIGLFAELGWAVAGEPGDAGWLGRETKGGVVLVSRLSRARSGLDRWNPTLPPETITAAIVTHLWGLGSPRVGALPFDLMKISQ